MRLFIIRPFGIKEGIDFERVDRELIQPAVAKLAPSGFPMGGGTTGEISRQGNIREDMFRLIVASDLVIADVSIHNANAFYELGIRHALRPRSTFLIRSRTEQAYPFDLQTDRYFLYDAANPAGNVDDLTQALRSTLASAEERDSPVFKLLPDLVPHGRGQLVKAPGEFQEDVERTRREGRRGDLRLFADEIGSFEWDQEGLRLIGDAQLKLRAFAGARETFESLRAAVPGDVQANLRLGTIYQRLTLTEPAENKPDLLARSDLAIRRVLDANPAASVQAEAYALLGSNEKSRWIEDFMQSPPADRAAQALRSPHLKSMLELYLKAANCDLNAHYPAVNALALLKVQLALAERSPKGWSELCDDDDQAEAALKARQMLAARLTSTLYLALEMDEVMGRKDGKPDPWAENSRADLLLLTAADKPQRVANKYREVLKDADRFNLEATRRNLAIYKDLGVFEPAVSAALEVVDNAIAATEKAQSAPTRVILFTGHMVDAPDRAADKARFPPTPEAEARARAMIEQAVRDELQGHEGSTLGIAGGACGGDLLFHEVLQQLGVDAELCLALPEKKFEVSSVQRGGAGWVERYRSLVERKVPRVLQQSEPLPNWLSDKKGYDLWQRNNLWMMFSALAKGARHLTIIALYNSEREPDGPGGTGHLVEEASRWGFKSVVLDARKLLSA